MGIDMGIDMSIDMCACVYTCTCVYAHVRVCALACAHRYAHGHIDVAVRVLRHLGRVGSGRVGSQSVVRVYMCACVRERESAGVWLSASPSRRPWLAASPPAAPACCLVLV